MSARVLFVALSSRAVTVLVTPRVTNEYDPNSLTTARAARRRLRPKDARLIAGHVYRPANLYAFF